MMLRLLYGQLYPTIPLRAVHLFAAHGIWEFATQRPALIEPSNLTNPQTAGTNWG